MIRILLYTTLVFIVSCEEPVPVEDVYQSEIDKKEVIRQENARVDANGLNAVGCPPDDKKCAVEASQKLLDEMNE